MQILKKKKNTERSYENEPNNFRKVSMWNYTKECNAKLKYIHIYVYICMYILLPHNKIILI